MKSKELIKLLQEIDPEGETECCIGNNDIHFLDKMPAYWDGTLEILSRDHTRDPYYNICGAKYTSQGSKINIRSLSITDAIGNDINLKIDYSEMGNKEKAIAYEIANNKTRQAQVDIDQDCELWLFTEWAKETAHGIANDTSTLLDTATEYFHKHISYKDPMPPDIAEQTKPYKHGVLHLSYKDKRHLQWTREIQLTFNGFDWELIKK